MDTDSCQSDWRRISTGLLYNLKYVLMNGLMTDLTIRLVNGEDIKEYKVHKLVFQLASEVFERMLNSTFKEGLSSIVEMKDIKPETFQLFLDHLYGQPLIITNVEQAFGLLHLADYYQIYSLKQNVINFCLCQSTEIPDFALLGLEVAEKFEAPALKESKLQYVSRNTKQVVQCGYFLKVSSEVIKTILEQDKISIREIDLFKAVRAWIQHNLAEKGESIKEMLIPKLRYSSMSLKEFIDGPIASELLKYNEIVPLMSRLFTKDCSVPLPVGFSEAKRICPNLLTTESLPLIKWISGGCHSSISMTTNKRIMLTHFFIYPALEPEEDEYEEDIRICLNGHEKQCFTGVVNAVDKIEIKLDEKIQLDKDVKYQLIIETSKTRRNVVGLYNKIIECENISFKFEVANIPGKYYHYLPLHSFLFES